MEVAMDPRNTSRAGFRLLGAVVTVAALGLVGCSAAKPAGGNVDVALQEWAVLPAQATVNAGPVSFKVTNTGPEDKHEMVIVKTDLAAASLPTNEFGKVDEEGSGMEVIGEVEEFDPGAAESATFELKPGAYVLICNILQDEPDGTKESHYKMGMYTAFTVK